MNAAPHQNQNPGREVPLWCPDMQEDQAHKHSDERQDQMGVDREGGSIWALLILLGCARGASICSGIAAVKSIQNVQKWDLWERPREEKSTDKAKHCLCFVDLPEMEKEQPQREGVGRKGQDRQLEPQLHLLVCFCASSLSAALGGTAGCKPATFM